MQKNKSSSKVIHGVFGRKKPAADFTRAASSSPREKYPFSPVFETAPRQPSSVCRVLKKLGKIF